MFVFCARGIYWYESRPKPPKPWNTNAVKADFDYTSVEGDKNTIVFVYTLQNNTDFDYKISEADSVSLGAKLEEENSVSMREEKDFVKGDWGTFVPAHSRVSFGIHIAYPYPEHERSDASPDEKNDFTSRVAQYVNKEMPNLDGFVIYDRATRYEIVFPSGWKKLAQEPLKKK